MAALGLTIGLFALWTCLGIGMLGLLGTVDNRLQRALLAPSVGLACFLLTVFLINRAGVPQASGARPTLVFLLIVGAGLLWRSRPAFSLREYLPFAAIFLLALLVTARPMLDYGFDWVSYSNDDMANYTLGAERTINYGFFDIPPAGDLLSGRDLSLGYWFANLGVRSGSEIMNGWVAALTSLSPHQVFMPLIFALHLALISAGGALACRTHRYRLAALLTCGLLAISALMSLGVLYQLISQVGGLTLLAATAFALMRPFTETNRVLLIRCGLLLALLGAALLVEYPEVVPFLGLSWLLYLGVLQVKRRLAIRPLAIVLSVAVVLGVGLLNSYVPTSVVFLWYQAGAGLAAPDLSLSLFPYYLVPSGLATLWGFQSVVSLTSEPWLSLSILLGGVLLLTAVFAAFYGALRGYSAGTMTLVMLGATVTLFSKHFDFGLYKLAMYLQPFMIPTLVLFWLDLPRWRGLQIAPLVWHGLQIAPLVAIGILGMHAQQQYVTLSRAIPGGVGGGLAELPDASRLRINQQFEQVIHQLGSESIVLDTLSITLAKFQSIYLRGHTSTFATQDYLSRTLQTDVGPQMFRPDIPVAAAALSAEYKKRFVDEAFALLDPTDPTLRDDFVKDLRQPPETESLSTVLVRTGPRQSLINRWSSPVGAPIFTVTRWDQVSNDLLFVSSSLGQPYFTISRARVAEYQLEPDLYRQDSLMAGLGRYLLFEVVNPSPSLRLVLDMTDTLKSDGENRLPPAVAVGSTRESFPLVGRGSARVFSPPLQPQLIDGRSYVAIDMGMDGQPFAYARSGLMRLYGTDVVLDARRLVGFGRDISSISEDQYQTLTPPTELDAFPSALWNPQLEYSGIYEDGWLSEEASFMLEQGTDTSTVHVHGSVPIVPNQPSGPVHLNVLVDGQPVAQQDVSPGDFDIRVVSPVSRGKHKVELQFGQLERLPAPDNRQVAAQLSVIGFEAGIPARDDPASAEDIVAPGSGIEVGAGWYPSDSFAGVNFRWAANDAELAVSGSALAPTALSFDLEPGPGTGGQPLPIHVIDERTGAPLLEAVLDRRRTLTVNMPHDGATDWRLRLRVDGGGQASGADPRILNFRVFHVGWADSPTAYTVDRLAQFAGDASTDIVPPTDVLQLRQGTVPTDGIALGGGWYPVETSRTDTFRWSANDAEIVVTRATGNRYRLQIELEPGPGMNGQPARIELMDNEGSVVAQRTSTGRRVETFDLPVKAGSANLFRLHVEGGGAPTPGDPRSLNFRVFRIAWDTSTTRG